MLVRWSTHGVGTGRTQHGPHPSAPGPTPQEAALRAFYITEDPRDFELQALPSTVQTGDPGGQGKARSGGTLEEEGSRGPSAREASPEAWTIRALPRPEEVLKIYPAWLK